ncbi:MAG: hypothetical protein AAF800_09830 [Planctomycetota bacterium]
MRRAAARHPSMPAETLRLLERAGATRDLTGYRPAAAGLSREEIETLVSLGEWGRRLAARYPGTPADRLVGLAASAASATRRLVAEHPACPGRTLTFLCGDADDGVRMAAARHPAVPRETVAMFRAAGSRLDLSGPAVGVPESAVDFGALMTLGVYGRQLAARHPWIEPGRLSELAHDPDWRVRAAVAENPSAAPGLLAGLVGLDTFETRRRVAAHPRSSTETLTSLVLEPDVRLRREVAGNPGTSPELLRRLALDGASAVRRVVAARSDFAEADRRLIEAAGSSHDLQSFADPTPGVTAEQLAELAERGGWGQRLAARHPATPGGVLGDLATSGDPVVRDLARRHSACPSCLLETLVAAGSTADLQGYERRDGALSGEAIETLVNAGPWARRLAARHRSTSADQLARLSDDQDPRVRREVAKHVRTPGMALDAMVWDVAHDVRWALVNREGLSSAAVAVLLRDTLPAVRLAAVVHPATTAEGLQAVRFDLDEDVRAAVGDRLAALCR